MTRAELEELATRIAQAENIPVRGFFALVQAESNWDINAVSPVGAQGLTQLMPGTAVEVGVTDPFDPEQSLLGGAQYLNLVKAWVLSAAPELAATPNELWPAILASYNWGIGNWRNAYRQHGDSWLCYVPEETELYVARVSPAFHNEGELIVNCAGGPPARARRFPWLLLLAVAAGLAWRQTR